ncbi:hypothetical protein [Actinomadura sp. NPDC048394]|jgi:hypothetical protein|uniref:hypothetical protein n=1 Tax=Actinomadura sp. NPDC048394 TaxID=3158223 RepID=UPI0033E7AA25
MNTFSTTAADTAPRTARPMGSLLTAISLVIGPALIALALATLPDLWNGSLPDYHTIDTQHDQAMLSFNLAAASFPFMFGSVVALAIAARRSRRLAATGLACSFFGLTAMLANAMLSMPLVLMSGITDHTGLDRLATRLDSPPLVPLFLFPLYFVGAILLAIALWRSGTVSGWAALAIGVGGMFPVALLTGVGALALPIAAIRIAGSIPIIKRLLAARDT